MGPPASADPVSLVNALVRRNLNFGITGTVAVLVGLSVLAIRARGEELTAAILRQRLFDLRCLAGAAAATLGLTVVITKGLVGWPLGLLCGPQREALQPVGAALGNYWGAAATGVLLAALVPALSSWWLDVRVLSGSSSFNKTDKDHHNFVKAEGLEFAPAKVVGIFATIITPALTGPLIELLKRVFL